MARPLWDVVADFTAGPPNTPGTSAVSLNSLAGTRSQAWDSRRGRQYELGTAEAGALTLSMFDRAENLNPVNATSPWNTGGNSLLPYRCIQVGAWWNTATLSLAGNCLNSANTVAGSTFAWDPTFENFVASSVPSGVTATSAASPADGGLPVTQIVAPNTSSTMIYTLRLVPGTSYTVVADVYATTGVTVEMAYSVGSTATILASTTTTGSYQSLSGTVTAQAGGFLWFGVTAATGGFPATFYVAGIRCVGLSPGWTVGGSASMRVTTTLAGGAHSGFYALNCGFTNATDSATVLVPTVPNTTYTFSAYVNPQVSGSVAKMAIGTASVSSSTTGAWQRLSLTWTTTAALTSVVFTAPSGTYTVSVYIDDIQLEIASAASAFSTSGPTFFPRYTGYIERYPQTWADAGFRGMKPLEAVDALSALSRTVINQSYQSTIMADSPYVYIPYSDLALPQQVQLPRGGQPQLGYSNLGTNGSVNFQGDSFLDGSPAVSITQQNASPTVSGNPAYITYSGTRGGVVSMSPQGFTIEAWAKVSSGTVYFGGGAVQPTENPNTEPLGPTYYVGWTTTQGALRLWFKDPNGSGNAFFGIGTGAFYGGYPDGTWHHFVLIFPGGNHVQSVVDGVVGGLASLSGTISASIGLNNFFVDATTYFGDPASTVSVANVAAYPFALSTARIQAHYNRGAGYINEVSGARVARLLAQYWSATNYTAAPGVIQLAPDYNYDPVGSPQSARTMLDVLQEISTTENGFVWANVNGKVIWEDRSTRVAQQASIATLGQGAGQVHFETLEYDYDPTYVYSQVNFTRPDNSNYAPQVNATSLAEYGQRILSATLQVNSDYDLGQAALFYLARYAAPGGAPGTSAGPRIRKLVLNPATDPTMWNFVLGLDLSQRITVAFKASSGLLMSYDYYVENIAESHDPAQGTHTVELQLSPVFVPTAGILGDATYGVLGSTTYVVY